MGCFKYIYICISNTVSMFHCCTFYITVVPTDIGGNILLQTKTHLDYFPTESNLHCNQCNHSDNVLYSDGCVICTLVQRVEIYLRTIYSIKFILKFWLDPLSLIYCIITVHIFHNMIEQKQLIIKHAS